MQKNSTTTEKPPNTLRLFLSSCIPTSVPQSQRRGHSPAMGIGQFVVLGGDFGQDLLRHLQEVPSTPGVLGQDGGAPRHDSEQDGHGSSPAGGQSRAQLRSWARGPAGWHRDLQGGTGTGRVARGPAGWPSAQGPGHSQDSDRTPRPQSSLISPFRFCSRRHKTLQKEGFLSPMCPALGDPTENSPCLVPTWISIC